MERYFTELATAFVRGRTGLPDATIQSGMKAGLRLHKFKRDSELPEGEEAQVPTGIGPFHFGGDHIVESRNSGGVDRVAPAFLHPPDVPTKNLGVAVCHLRQGCCY